MEEGIKVALSSVNLAFANLSAWLSCINCSKKVSNPTVDSEFSAWCWQLAVYPETLWAVVLLLLRTVYDSWQQRKVMLRLICLLWHWKFPSQIALKCMFFQTNSWIYFRRFSVDYFSVKMVFFHQGIWRQVCTARTSFLLKFKHLFYSPSII